MRQEISRLATIAFGITLPFLAVNNAGATLNQGRVDENTNSEGARTSDSFNVEDLIFFDYNRRAFVLRFDSDGDGMDDISITYPIRGIVGRTTFYLGDLHSVGIDFDKDGEYRGEEIIPIYDHGEIKNIWGSLDFANINHGNSIILIFDQTRDKREDLKLVYKLTGRGHGGFRTDLVGVYEDIDDDGRYGVDEVLFSPGMGLISP